MNMYVYNCIKPFNIYTNIYNPRSLETPRGMRIPHNSD